MFLCAAILVCLCLDTQAFSQALIYGGTRYNPRVQPRYFPRSGTFRRTFSRHGFTRQVDPKYRPYRPASKQISSTSERQPMNVQLASRFMPIQPASRLQNLQPAPQPQNHQSTPRPIFAPLPLVLESAPRSQTLQPAPRTMSVLMPLVLEPAPRPPNLQPAPRTTTIETTVRPPNPQPGPRPMSAPLPLNLLPEPRPPSLQPVSPSNAIHTTTQPMPFQHANLTQDSGRHHQQLQNAFIVISQDPEVSKEIKKAIIAHHELKALQSVLYYR